MDPQPAAGLFSGALLAALKELLNNPGSAWVILPISILAFVLEKLPQFPNKLILPMCLAAGSVLFPNLVSRATVPPEFPSPILVLILNGFVLGFISWILHTTLIVWAINRVNAFTGSDKTQPPPSPPTNPPQP